MFKKLALTALLMSSTVSASESSNLSETEVFNGFISDLVSKLTFTSYCGFSNEQQEKDFEFYAGLARDIGGREYALRAIQDGIEEFRRIENRGGMEQKSKCAVAYLQLKGDEKLAFEWAEKVK